MTVFETLNALNVNTHTEKKNTGKDRNGKPIELTYLSWCWAWAEVVKRYPDANYEIEKNPQGLPYFSDPMIGLMVYTKVTIEGVTREMWLPVMDGANNAMKVEPYEIQTKWGPKPVAAATMFDVNKAVMRCLTKNLAMFGLGLYIYAGEDLPEGEEIKPEPLPADAKKPGEKIEYTKKPFDYHIEIQRWCERMGITGEQFHAFRKALIDGGVVKNIKYNDLEPVDLDNLFSAIQANYSDMLKGLSA